MKWYHDLMDRLLGKDQLDEMQEQQLARRESGRLWLVFFALLIAIFAQQFSGAPFRQYAGEFVIFMGLCVVSIVGDLRCGLWDRRLRPNFKTNLILSLGAGAFVAAYGGAFVAVRIADVPAWVVALAALIGGGCTFLLTLGLLQLCMALYKRRRRALEQDEE
ncbi:MAG: DUF6773 family protein [Gemmiger sp.]